MTEDRKNDIDFDELDKAVTSLMGKVGGETLEDSDKMKTLAINSTLQPDEKPKYDALGKAAEAIGHEALDRGNEHEVELDEDLGEPSLDSQPPTIQPHVVTEEPTRPKPVTRPSNGRFMDMVHPKADMRQNKTATTSSGLIVPNRSTMAMPVTPTPAAAEAPPRSEVKADQPAGFADVPITTPFLPDAKVEKRPLGGIDSTAGVEPGKAGTVTYETPEDLSDSDESPSAVFETQSINSEVRQADNGSNDEQRALNASDFEKESVTEQVLTKIEAAEAKGDESLTIEKVESGDTESLKPEKQSYEAAQTDRANEGAIYDVKNYHQPLNHPPKQKSGWGTVIIIAVIILVAAVLAGGAYFVFGLRG